MKNLGAYEIINNGVQTCVPCENSLYDCVKCLNKNVLIFNRFF